MSAPFVNDDSTLDYLDALEAEQRLGQGDETLDALDELESTSGALETDEAATEATPESVGEIDLFSAPESAAGGDKVADTGLTGLVTGERKPKGQGAANVISSGFAHTGLNLLDSLRFVASPVLPDDLNDDARSFIDDQRKLVGDFYQDAEATTFESLAKGGIQVGLSFLVTGGVAGRAASGIGGFLSKAPRISKAVAGSIKYGVPGEIAFNPYDPRLSNIMAAEAADESPNSGILSKVGHGVSVLNSPLAGALAANPDDPEWLARGKSAVEGGLVGKALGTLAQGFGKAARAAFARNAKATQQFDEAFAGTPLASHIRAEADEALAGGTPLDPAAMGQSRYPVPAQVESPFALLPERIPTGSELIAEGRVPRDILVAAQDANYARAFVKDLEDAVIQVPKSAADVERAKVLAAQTKLARDEAKEVARAARAKWEAMQADPRWQTLPDAVRVELKALAETGQEGVVRFERVAPAETPLNGSYIFPDAGKVESIEGFGREAQSRLRKEFPNAKLAYEGTDAKGVPSYTVEWLEGHGSEKALLRLRSALRKAHPGAAEVNIQAIAADTRGVTQRLMGDAPTGGSGDFGPLMQTIRLPLNKRAVPAVFRPSKAAQAVDAGPRTIGGNAVQSEVIPGQVLEFDPEGRVLFQQEITDQVKHVDFSTMEAEEVLELIDEYTTGAEVYALRDADGELENTFALLQSNQKAAARETGKELAEKRAAGVAERAAVHEAVSEVVHREVATQAQDLARTVQSGSASAADEMRLVQAIRTVEKLSGSELAPAPKPARAKSSGAVTQPTSQLDEAISSVTGGGGRRELRALAKELNAVEPSQVPGRLAKFREAVARQAAGLEAALRKYGQARFPRARKAEKALQEWYGNSLLYDIETTVRNTTSNTTLFAADQINETLRAFWRGVGQGNVAEETVIEATARSRGAALQVLHTAQATIAAFRNSADDLAKVRNTVARESGERVKRAWQTEQTQLGEAGGAAVLPPHIQVPYLGTFIRVPRRINTTVDEFSKGMNYATEIAAEGYRVGYRKGLRSTDLDDFANRYHEIADPVTRERVAEKALAKANRNVFTEPLGPLGKVGEALLEALPFGRVLVPFYRIPLNIAKMTFRTDPIGALVRDALAEDSALRMLVQTKDWRRVLQTPEGQDLAARLTMGAGIWAMAGTLVSADRISGSAPSDPRDREVWELQGRKEYSIKIGGHWVPAAFIGPYAITLFAAADVWTALDEVKERSPEAAEGMVTALSLGYVKALKNLNYMQGVWRMLDAVQNPERSFIGTAGRFAGGFIPSFMERFPERLDLFTPFNVDGTVRDPKHYKANGDLVRMRTALNQFAIDAGFQGFFDIPPKFTLTGPEVRLPFAARAADGAPIAQEMARIGMGLDFDRRLRTINGYTLSNAEYRDFGYFVKDFKIGGKTLVEKLNEDVQSKDWQTLTDGNPAQGMIGSKHQHIAGVLDVYMTEAEKAFLGQRPDVFEKMATMYRENLRVKVEDTPPDPTNETLKALLAGSDR